MAKITFTLDPMTRKFDGTPREEYEKCFISQEDFDLAVEISNAGGGKDTAFAILEKSRPEKVVYADNGEILIPACLVIDNTGQEEVQLLFDNKTPGGTRVWPEDGDVIYTNMIEAIEATNRIVDSVNTDSLKKNDNLEDAAYNSLADVFSKISDAIRNRKNIQEQIADDFSQMSEEEKQRKAQKASIKMRQITLIQRRTMLTQLIDEIDKELYVMRKLNENLDEGYDIFGNNNNEDDE